MMLSPKKKLIARVASIVITAIVISNTYCKSAENRQTIVPLTGASSIATKRYMLSLEENNYDLKQLQALEQQIGKASNGFTITDFGALMNQICDNLITKDFHDAKQYTLENQYAMIALNAKGELPLDIEVPLLLHASRVDIQSGELDWPLRRKVSAEHFIHAWNQIQAGIDLKFDPEAASDSVQINVVPPPESNLMPGANPEEIKDARLRTLYLKDIQDNESLKKHIEQQRQYRNFLKSFVPKAQSYLVEAYSAKPYSGQEIRGLLKASLIPLKNRLEILQQVSIRVKA